jgi:hypothetical protein
MQVNIRLTHDEAKLLRAAVERRREKFPGHRFTASGIFREALLALIKAEAHATRR